MKTGLASVTATHRWKRGSNGICFKVCFFYYSFPFVALLVKKKEGQMEKNAYLCTKF